MAERRKRQRGNTGGFGGNTGGFTDFIENLRQIKPSKLGWAGILGINPRDLRWDIGEVMTWRRPLESHRTQGISRKWNHAKRVQRVFVLAPWVLEFWDPTKVDYSSILYVKALLYWVGDPGEHWLELTVELNHLKSNFLIVQPFNDVKKREVANEDLKLY